MMCITDFLIMMLVDVLTSGEMFYFSLSTLKLSYKTLKHCMKGEDYKTVIFKILSYGVRRMDLSLYELRTKFERFDFGTSALFKDNNCKFKPISKWFNSLTLSCNSLKCN